MCSNCDVATCCDCKFMLECGTCYTSFCDDCDGVGSEFIFCDACSECYCANNKACHCKCTKAEQMGTKTGTRKVKPNAKCPCNSGKKYKKCCRP